MPFLPASDGRGDIGRDVDGNQKGIEKGAGGPQLTVAQVGDQQTHNHERDETYLESKIRLFDK